MLDMGEWCDLFYLGEEVYLLEKWAAGRTKAKEVGPVRKSLQQLKKDAIMAWTRMQG